MTPDLSALIDALSRTRALLSRYGDTWVAGRLAELETRLATGDVSAVESAVSEATGGMGSLNDRRLSTANGDRVEAADEHEVNVQLRSLVRETERAARAAAAQLGLSLHR